MRSDPVSDHLVPRQILLFGKLRLHLELVQALVEAGLLVLLQVSPYGRVLRHLIQDSFCRVAHLGKVFLHEEVPRHLLVIVDVLVLSLLSEQLAILQLSLQLLFSYSAVALELVLGNFLCLLLLQFQNGQVNLDLGLWKLLKQ